MMNFFVANFFLATVAITVPTAGNWCTVGHIVMVPDGREGPVVSLNGDMCDVMDYGDGHVSQWAYFSIEPVYPQKLDPFTFGH